MRKKLYDYSSVKLVLDNNVEKKFSFLYLGGKRLEDTERSRVPVVLPPERDSFILSKCVAICVFS